MKTKKQRKTKKNIKPGTRPKHYPVEYFGIALLAFVLIETAMIGNVTSADFKSAMEVFDLSNQVAATSQTFVSAVEPMVTMAADVDQFYQLTAMEVSNLLDLSEQYEDVVLVVSGVNEFYQLASLQMEQLLDASMDYGYMPQVAGASIESCN